MNLFCFRYYEFVRFLFNRFPTLFFVGHSKSVGDVFLNKKPLKTKLQEKNLLHSSKKSSQKEIKQRIFTRFKGSGINFHVLAHWIYNPHFEGTVSNFWESPKRFLS